ncbi:MAG: NRDE family protein [Solirubrobacterales bacterium]
MCTLVLLRRTNHHWPLLIAANRDEMAGRPWRAPGRHWPDRAEVVAGLDELAGGSWMGLNDFGVTAAILNRTGTLGPAAGKRSRGELVLEALDHADAVVAAEALAQLDGRAYRAFNMVVADNRDAFWIRADGGARVHVHPIGEGLHMLTALDLDDRASPRVAAYLPRFRAAATPAPETGDWSEWTRLLADGGGGTDGEEMPAMCFTRPDGFGTVSSSLLALPAVEAEAKPLWLFAPGRPDRAEYAPLALG